MALAKAFWYYLAGFATCFALITGVIRLKEHHLGSGGILLLGAAMIIMTTTVFATTENARNRGNKAQRELRALMDELHWDLADQARLKKATFTDTSDEDSRLRNPHPPEIR